MARSAAFAWWQFPSTNAPSFLRRWPRWRRFPLATQIWNRRPDASAMANANATETSTIAETTTFTFADPRFFLQRRRLRHRHRHLRPHRHHRLLLVRLPLLPPHHHLCPRRDLRHRHHRLAHLPPRHPRTPVLLFPTRTSFHPADGARAREGRRSLRRSYPAGGHGSFSMSLGLPAEV